MIVVKIGGSVAANAQSIIETLKDCKKDILIVPGGWVFADLVRKLDADDTTAHWMAVKAMDIYGLYLSKFAPAIEPDDFDFDVHGVNVILPYRIVRIYDELPHSWDVTSDSIAIWIAEKMNAEEIVKLTDVDGIIIDGKLIDEIAACELSFQSCLDRFAPKLLREYRRDLFICNGLDVRRVKDYIMRGKAKGTKVIGRW